MRGIPPKRGIDGAGNGAFGSSRERNGYRYTHKGEDFLFAPGTQITPDCVGVITKHGYVYADDLRWRYVQVTNSDDLRFRYMYVTLHPNAAIGDKVNHDDVIGVMQDISKKYGRAKPHVHLEIKNEDNEYLDPNDFM